MKKPKYLFSEWDKAKEALKGKFIYVFLDFDGTLAPIAGTPDKTRMPNNTKILLRQLSESPDFKLAVISGRAVSDLKNRIGLKNIIYVGNHGFEINGPKITFKSPVPPRYRRTLDEIKAKLENNLSSIKGLLIEDKGFSLSMHYRLVGKRNIPKVKTEFYSALVVHEVRGDISVRHGKKVLDIRPPLVWDKGKVVLWLLARHKFAMRTKKREVLPIYIGDDVTDEDAFQALSNRGPTIFVGKPTKTKARFYLKNTKEVAELLKTIVKIPQGE